MKTISKNTLIGYSAGITTGITYGLNPLFAVPLMNAGASVEAILFFRYGLSVLLLGTFLLLHKQSFKLSGKQAGTLLLLGLLYTFSSIFLFEAYKFIASGLATTLIFLYPVLVALIMMFLKVRPSWQVWLSILLTFIGVITMTQSDTDQMIKPEGIWLSLGSALVYAFFIVIINRNKAITALPNSLLTFYTLLVGTLLFSTRILTSHTAIGTGLDYSHAWFNLLGLALLPTIVSTATLALATRKIGATKASVLGVFEPITAILVGTLAFGEALTANILIGITLSVAAITFMILSAKKNGM